MHRPRRPPPAGGAKRPAPGRRACRGIGCRGRHLEPAPSFGRCSGPGYRGGAVPSHRFV